MVSIAPLWNWKDWVRWKFVTFVCFNRTFMELKALIVINNEMWCLRFNRTFMELKEASIVLCVFWISCFNRTFMELKAIGTSWTSFRLPFQSHLYGIESRRARWVSHHTNRFNRTFMELKEGTREMYDLQVAVSIAPLWNWKWSLGRTSCKQ